MSRYTCESCIKFWIFQKPEGLLGLASSGPCLGELGPQCLGELVLKGDLEYLTKRQVSTDGLEQCCLTPFVPL